MALWSQISLFSGYVLLNGLFDWQWLLYLLFVWRGISAE